MVANNLIVMTWNVENLFPAEDTDTSATETYTAKLTYLAGLITGSGTDVVALHETGSVRTAQGLQAALGETGRPSRPPNRTATASASPAVATAKANLTLYVIVVARLRWDLRSRG